MNVFENIWKLKVEQKVLTLGEVLDGDRMAASDYNISFKGVAPCIVWLDIY